MSALFTGNPPSPNHSYYYTLYASPSCRPSYERTKRLRERLFSRHEQSRRARVVVFEQVEAWARARQGIGDCLPSLAGPALNRLGAVFSRREATPLVDNELSASNETVFRCLHRTMRGHRQHRSASQAGETLWDPKADSRGTAGTHGNVVAALAVAFDIVRGQILRRKIKNTRRRR